MKGGSGYDREKLMQTLITPIKFAWFFENLSRNYHKITLVNLATVKNEVKISQCKWDFTNRRFSMR